MNRRYEQIISAIATGLVLGSAACFIASQILWLQYTDFYTTFRGWHFHIPVVSFLQSHHYNPFELAGLILGKNGMALPHYPPFGYLPLSFFATNAGQSAAAFYQAGLLWWGLLVVVSFLLGRKIAGSHLGGSLVCALFAFNPLVLVHIHAINIDLPKTVMVGLFAYAVLTSDFFNRKWMTWIIGGLAGFAVLTRPSTLLLVALISVGAVLTGSEERKERIVRLILAGATGAALAAAFYWVIMPILLQDSSDHLWFSLGELKNHTIISAQQFYLITTWYELVLYGIGVLLLFWMKDFYRSFLGLWVFGSYGILIFFRVIGLELLLPTILGLVLICVRAISILQPFKKAHAVFLITALLVCGLFSYHLWVIGCDRACYFDDEYRDCASRSSWRTRHYFSLLDTQRKIPVKHAVAQTLQYHYGDVDPDRIVVAGHDLNDINFIRNVTSVYIGRDRPETLIDFAYLPEVWESDRLVDYLADAPWAFHAKLLRSALILWYEQPSFNDSYQAACGGQSKEPICLNYSLMQTCTFEQFRFPFEDGQVVFRKPDLNCLLQKRRSNEAFQKPSEDTAFATLQSPTITDLHRAEKGIRLALDEIKQGIASEDFEKAGRHMTPQMADRWWLAGLQSLYSRLDKMDPEFRDSIKRALAVYNEMIESAEIGEIIAEGWEWKVTITMKVVIGDLQYIAAIPTKWIAANDQWKLAAAMTTMEDVPHTAEVMFDDKGKRIKHEGYPPSVPSPENRLKVKEAPGKANFKCPNGMTPIPKGPVVRRYDGLRYLMADKKDHREDVENFCIDTYEASRPTATRDFSGEGADHPATSRKEAIPWVRVTWQEADQACKKASKRLCSGAEWQKAFGGPGGWIYPYGNDFDPAKCNTGDLESGTGALAPTGSYPDCKSPYGVFDMAGNASEWTDETWQKGKNDHVVRGDSFNVNTQNDQALYPFLGWRFTGYNSKNSAIHHHPAGVRHEDDAFRCCLTP